MRFNRISLHNIRSYRNAEIEFPEGPVLLSGDIGSGKSSILLALEFALFGLQRGKSGEGLLRNGEKEGKVKLNFELDGKKIEIERSLKRSKDSVQSENCIISVNGEKKQLSANELRSSMLRLFNYPSEFLSKNPVLYKYTVYTQQEEMKSILLEEPEERLNTLRRVFNIDRYKRIIENTEKFTSKLREEIRVNETRAQNIESKKNEKELRKQEVVKIKTEVATLNLKLNELKSIVSERKNKVGVLEDEIKELNKLKQELSSANSELFMKKERLDCNKKEIEIISKQITGLEAELKGKRFEEIEKTESEIKKLEREIEKKEAEGSAANKKVISFEVEKARHEKIAKDIIGLKTCPTCQQDVAEGHKHSIKSKSDNEISAIEKSLVIEIQKRKEIDDSVKRMKSEISALRLKDKELSVLKFKFSNLENHRMSAKRFEESNEILEKSIAMLKVKKDELEARTKDFSELEKSYSMAKRMLDEVREEEKEKEISKARFERQLEDILALMVIMDKEIEDMERAKSIIMKMSKLKNFLEEEFISAVIAIEKNVMIKLHADFSELFGKWFSMLVNDLNARINEDFTPIVEQNGYEIDYSFLSGGERTAAALAYRLALNQIINSILSNIKTRDVLILDEPTEGFSSEQLDKMREVLNELKANQLIIVSHEQKIESFVENVINLNKDDGITRIM
jgi:exonuclease SbcC